MPIFEIALPSQRTITRHKSVILVLALACAALILALVIPPVASARATSGKSESSRTVETPYGTVQGKSLGGAQAFYGLPFAQPPVYDLAFKSPVEPAKWSGVRDATRQGPACLQFAPTGVKNQQATSLDCLYLDVYRPANVDKRQKLPVMLWYHGGGFTQGAGSLYGGQTMADRTNTVIVSTNYRLGAVGGLSLPALDAEHPQLGSGNYAIEDQVQALKWIRKAISSFGGDPHNVTIFGQSAGGSAVCNMLATPLATGLFSKAIIQSWSCTPTGKTVAAQQVTSTRYAAAVGCPTTDPAALTCLRNAWPGALVSAAQSVNVTSGVIGTGVLPQASGAAIEAGTWNKVPVIVGGTRWEAKLLNLASRAITGPEYEQQVLDRFGAVAGPLVLAKYPLSDYASPFQALAALNTDTGFGCRVDTNANLFRGKTPVFRFEFNDPTSPTLFGFQEPGIDMSSAHSAELAYLFDFTLGDRPLTAQQKKLGHAMQDYWAAFAARGTPSVKGGITWPEYTADNKAIVFAPKITVTNSLSEEHNCAFFASLPSP